MSSDNFKSYDIGGLADRLTRLREEYEALIPPASNLVSLKMPIQEAARGDAQARQEYLNQWYAWLSSDIALGRISYIDRDQSPNAKRYRLRFTYPHSYLFEVMDSYYALVEAYPIDSDAGAFVNSSGEEVYRMHAIPDSARPLAGDIIILPSFFPRDDASIIQTDDDAEAALYLETEHVFRLTRPDMDPVIRRFCEQIVDPTSEEKSGLAKFHAANYVELTAYHSTLSYCLRRDYKMSESEEIHNVNF